MFWDDFASLIRRNATPCAQLSFISPSRQQSKIVTIMDWSRRRRADRIVGASEKIAGYDEVHELELARVCNASWLHGQIPLLGWGSETKVDLATGNEYNTLPVRGALTVLKILLANNVLVPSPEIAQWIEMPEKHCPRERWYVY